MKLRYLTAAFLLSAATANAQSGAIFESWMYNTDGSKASYATQGKGGTQTTNLTEESDIQSLKYDNDYVYVSCDGLASYTMGPWSVPDFYVEAQGYVYQFPRTPSENTGNKTAVPTGGAIGAAVNGIPLYGNRSADSYKSSTGELTMQGGDDIWHADAWVNEGETMDESGTGHPANGRYHYHARPSAIDQSTGTTHSALIGFAADGYPIYGPYGYDNPNDANSPIVLVESSYQKRDITQRRTLADGTSLSPNQYGPDVTTGGDWDIGTFVEDYEYVASSGHLDEYNGRVCVTPEYPEGTYAYFTTFESATEPAFPYILHEYYYGTVSSTNVGNANIPGGATSYDPSTSVKELATVNVALFPNPTSGITTISGEAGVKYQLVVVNMLGETLTQVQFTGTTQVDVSGFEPGAYFARISGGETSQTYKLVRQ